MFFSIDISEPPKGNSVSLVEGASVTVMRPGYTGRNWSGRVFNFATEGRELVEARKHEPTRSWKEVRDDLGW